MYEIGLRGDWKERESAFRQSWKVPGGFWHVPVSGGNAVEKSKNDWENQQRKENGRFGSKIRECSAFTKAAKKRIAHKLCSVRVADVESGIIKAGEGKTAIQAAQEWAEQNNQTDARTLIGTVNTGKKAIKASLSHGFSQTKLDAIPAIKPVLEQGQYLGYLNDFGGATMRNHFFAGRVGFPDGEKIVFCRVREAIGSKGHFYVHEVFTEDEIKSKGAILQTAAAHQEDGWPHGGTPLYISILNEILGDVKRVEKALAEREIFRRVPAGWKIEDIIEFLKSHLYSRKEFRNGAWRYYYDKHNNFSRMKRCRSKALYFKRDESLPESEQCKQIVKQAENYIQNVWIKDWENKTPRDKSICMELRNKEIVFEEISFRHLAAQGKNSKGGARNRDLHNLLQHARYLPCAKELLEGTGVWTHARYEPLQKPRVDKKTGKTVVANIYQSVTGLAPKGDTKKYVQVTVSKVKYSDGTYGKTVYMSVIGLNKKELKKSTVIPCFPVGKSGMREQQSRLTVGPAPINPTSVEEPRNDNINRNPVFCNKNIGKNIEIFMKDVTEGNRAAKFAELEKCLTGGVPSYVAADGTRKLGDVRVMLADLSAPRVEKALRTMAFSLDVPLKAAKGEAFAFKAQEDLVERWMRFFSDVTRRAYNFILEFFGLPEITVMRKAVVLTHKGAVLYSPETGEPIKQKDWDRFVKNLEDFLNRELKDAGKRIVLDGRALGVILDRMLKYNTLEAVKQARLSGLTYRGKPFDWISEEVKRLASVTGEPVTRAEAARIEVMRQSAAQRITNMSDAMKADVRQILIDGVKNRQSGTRVSQALFDKFVGYNRNFQRIADTEIQNAVNRAVLLEETNSAPEGEKVYFQRMEIIDDNTCEFCKRMNGKIAVWSGVPLPDERVKDEYADFAIWDGKEWDGKKNIAATGAFHPYCRGMWVRWRPEGRAANAFTAEIFRRGKKWKEAVMRAKEEFRAKGVENPDDRTAGFTDRIQELFGGVDKRT